MDKKQQTHISKFLSFVLRHQPEEIGLNLDANGWANIQELVEKSKEKQNMLFSIEDLFLIVRENDKQRFILSQDKTQIKANQGHTIQVELNLENVEPPEYLYHGTATRFLSSITKEGLKPMKRHDVHLSFRSDVAFNVGSRHGKPKVLKIKAKDMHRDGLTFQCTPNNVWLTKFVDPKYILLD